MEVHVFSSPRIPAAAMIALALTLSACGRTARDDEGAGGGEPRSATENNIKATPRDQVQDGGRMTWPIDSMVTHFNYHHIDGGEHSHSHIILALMPLPYLADAGGTPQWNRNLLASEPELATEPRQVVTYRIHPQAVWDDGTPITWEDFHWQWRALNGTNKAYQVRGTTGYDVIESVERGSDDREVVVTFKGNFADWRGMFYPVYPASATKSPQAFNDAWKSRPLTTAGPFKLDRIDQTAKTITLVRNEKWWGEPAKLDTIVYRAIDIDAQIDALANGEIDLMDVGPDANKYQRATSISGADIRIAGGPNFRHITINGTGSILQDVTVRRALAMAIDRAAIARAMLGPLGIQPQTLGNHIFMANQAGYQDNSGDVGTFDPARAAQLLDQAGWRLDGGVRRKDGRALDITMVIPSAVATSRQESELVQNMLAQVGARLTIDTVPTGDFFEKYVRPGQFDFTIFSWIGTPYPISSAMGVYAKPTTLPNGQMAIQQNFARVGSDEIDRLFTEANQELDRQRAIELANRLDALIWEQVHSLTLYQRPEVWAVKRDLVNIGAVGFADLTFQDIGWATR